MKKQIKFATIATLCVGVFSCNLDEEVLGDYTKPTVVENPGIYNSVNVTNSTPNDGLAGAFGRVLDGTANHGGYFSLQELSSDETVITQKGGDWFDGGVLIDMHQHNFSPVSFGINGTWTGTYGGITQCNDLLNDGLSASQNAQLRLLRAYFYWRLMDLFGNVKIATDPLTDVPQSTRAQVFAFIESELLAIIPDLPTGKPAYGRVSQGAAYALLARIYLNAQVYIGVPKYQEAIDAADAVINSGVYSLASNYANLFSPDNAVDKGSDTSPVSNEVLFLAPFDEKTGQGMNFAQMTLHYPSQLTFKLTAQPWNGYSTLEEFYNSYETADVRKANNFIAGPQLDFAGNPILDLAFDKADPDGAPINYTPEINQLKPNGSRQAGARLGKFKFKAGQTPNMDNDYPLLRYAEVLLNKAEALARLNGFSDGTALTLVNEVRDRAGVAPLGSLTADNLLAERGRELFMEALRRPDLIRFGRFHDAWWEKPAHADDHRKLFPIPNEQILATAPSTCCKLVQNPGYN
jgi:starch-binding outer membrane protein, SusD/RagB family